MTDLKTSWKWLMKRGTLPTTATISLLAVRARHYVQPKRYDMTKEDLKVGMKVHADSCGKMYEVVDLSNTSNGWVGIKTDLYDNLAWPITTILALN